MLVVDKYDKYIISSCKSKPELSNEASARRVSSDGACCDYEKYHIFRALIACVSSYLFINLLSIRYGVTVKLLPDYRT